MWKNGEPFYTVDGNVNWYSHCGEQNGGFLKKLKIELPFDPAIPFLVNIWKNINSKKYMHPNVHCSTTYNGQDMETT